MPSNGMQTPTPDLPTAATNLDRALREFQDALKATPIARAPGTPLFEALRSWRADLARTRAVPPYIIASDAMLHAIEKARPTDMEALKAVRGVGETRVAQYGEQILEVVAQTPA